MITALTRSHGIFSRMEKKERRKKKKIKTEKEIALLPYCRNALEMEREEIH